MAFVKINNSNPNGIAKAAKAPLETFGINFYKIRGQDHNGARVIRGTHGDVQKLIKDVINFAVSILHSGCHK